MSSSPMMGMYSTLQFLRRPFSGLLESEEWKSETQESVKNLENWKQTD